MKRAVALGADHGGYALKQDLAARLSEINYEILDVGAHSYQKTDDYPDLVLEAADSVLSGKVQRAIFICGSGVGACITANKIPGIRAGVCHDTYSAHQGVEHDDMNFLCMGARVIGIELAVELAKAFLEADFSNDERHVRRLAKVRNIEQQYRK